MKDDPLIKGSLNSPIKSSKQFMMDKKTFKTEHNKHPHTTHTHIQVGGWGGGRAVAAASMEAVPDK